MTGPPGEGRTPLDARCTGGAVRRQRLDDPVRAAAGEVREARWRHASVLVGVHRWRDTVDRDRHLPREPGQCGQPAGVVHGTFVSLFVFFNCFALNQWPQYRQIGKRRDYLYGESLACIAAFGAARDGQSSRRAHKDRRTVGKVTPRSRYVAASGDTVVGVPDGI